MNMTMISNIAVELGIRPEGLDAEALKKKISAKKKKDLLGAFERLASERPT